jgi:hypothetical protein
MPPVFRRALVSALLLLPVGASAQSPIPVSVELPFRTNYYFAGIPFAAKEIQQAQVSVGLGSFTVYGFATYGFEESDITEADIFADWYTQLTPLLGFFVGGALYNFDYGELAGGWQGTQEVYAGLVLGTLLNPTVLVAHDFELGDGTHVLATVSHNVPLGTSPLSLDLAANVDYNAEYYTADSGFSYGNASVALNVPVGPLTFSPIVIVQRRLDDAFAGYVPDDEVFGITAYFGL